MGSTKLLPAVEFELHPEGWHKAHILFQLGRKSYYLSKAHQYLPDGTRYDWFPVWSNEQFDPQEHEHIVAMWQIRLNQLVVE